MTGELFFDVALCAVLAGVAMAACAASDALDGAILFGLFGLLMATAWLRLGAPDLALVEAVIELIVILFFGVLGFLRRAVDAPPGAPPATTARSRWTGFAAGLPLALLVGAVLWTSRLWEQRSSLGLRVDAALTDGGIENPVTAVLLDFRSVDTLLEIAVLLLALVAIHAIEPRESDARAGRLLDPSRHGMPTLAWFARRVVPVGLLLATYLWYAGSSEAGGAFQAGALIAGMVGIAFMTDIMPWPRPEAAWARWTAAGGLVVFAAIALGLVLAGHAPLGYPEGGAKAFILGIEAVLTVAIGMTLGAIVVAVPGRSRFR